MFIKFVTIKLRLKAIIMFVLKLNASYIYNPTHVDN